MHEEAGKEKLNELLHELQFCRDTLKKNTDEINQLNQKLAELEEQISIDAITKSKLYSILSHDLRSPFNGLLGFANFLVDEAENLSRDEIKTFTSNISSSARGLLGLIDKVFEWVKLEAGNYEYLPSIIDLKYIVNEVFFQNSKKAEAKNLKLTNNIPENTSAFADLDMIRAVVDHLISNAVKFTPNNGEIKVNALDKGDSIEISVTDTGTGISDEDKEKLFKTNAKYSTRGTANERGPGLGLIISRKIMEINKGKISATSELGRGSTFTITLLKEMP